MNSRLLTSVVVLSLVCGASAKNQPVTFPSAFALVREANKYVDPQARDKVVEIHSEKSAGRLSPDTWYIEYYDASVRFKATEVKLVDGQEAKISRPNHLRSWFTGTRPLDWDKVKIDSDKALVIALKQPEVWKLDLEASQFWLERTANGSNWKIRLWAAWPAGITDVYISTKNGAVVKLESHRQGRR